MSAFIHFENLINPIKEMKSNEACSGSHTMCAHSRIVDALERIHFEKLYESISREWEGTKESSTQVRICAHLFNMLRFYFHEHPFSVDTGENDRLLNRVHIFTGICLHFRFVHRAPQCFNANKSLRWCTWAKQLGIMMWVSKSSHKKGRVNSGNNAH